MDECQDINAAQDAIIRAVSRSADREAVSTGNRFLVGDVKQSIYRFRLADPTIFREYEKQWRNSKDGQRIPLSDNFRSREGVLDFINSLFGEIMRPCVGGIAYDGDARLRFGAPHWREALQADASAPPRVELHVIYKAARDAVSDTIGNNEADESSVTEANGASEKASAQTPVEDLIALEKEARLVAHLLRDLRARGHEIWDAGKMRAVDWKDMVVLLRSPGKRVETFAKEFNRAGVPLAAERAGFYSAIEVKDLLNLLRLLDNPLQDIPLAAVLRSPLVGMSLEELALARIAGHAEGAAPFFAIVRRASVRSAGHPSGAELFEQQAGLEAGTSGQTKLAKFFQQFEHWRQLIRQTSLSHCLETVLAGTHYEALLLAGERGRERVANVRRLLDLARQYDPYQRQGLHRFLRFVTEQEDAGLDEDAAVVETTNAVRLMSIHASKGLEFPVVALACLGTQFNTRDLHEDILLEPELGLCPRVWPPDGEQRYPSLPWWIARRREKREQFGEELRLLYVAMTRARDTLLLTAFDKSKDGGRRWAERSGISDRALANERDYFGWLRLWVERVTTNSNWESDARGQTDLLRWRKYAETDEMFSNVQRLIVAQNASTNVELSFDLSALRERIFWKYPQAHTQKETAKTNVSLLRRRAMQEDEDAQPLFQRGRGARREGTLGAVDVGVAHHTFLQHMNLKRVASLVDLRNEAERIVAQSQLTREAADALNFEALLNFWQSAAGRAIGAQANFVHRELPFTARFTLEQLAQLGFAKLAAADEFIVVQGVVDLAVLRPGSISILDFKTDTFRRAELNAKVRDYVPQLRLYASALSRIYARPVTELSLHFLTLGETVAISAN